MADEEQQAGEPQAEQSQEALPGVAGMAQGQRGVVDEPAAPPEQPDNLVTGADALEEQQKNPELDDNSGARP
jgi:hypothetical protein